MAGTDQGQKESARGDLLSALIFEPRLALNANGRGVRTERHIAINGHWRAAKAWVQHAYVRAGISEGASEPAHLLLLLGLRALAIILQLLLLLPLLPLRERTTADVRKAEARPSTMAHSGHGHSADTRRWTRA
jgi:hypothetical protein